MHPRNVIERAVVDRGDVPLVAVRFVMSGRYGVDAAALAGRGLCSPRGIVRRLLFGSDYNFKSFLLMRRNGRDQNGDQK
jgi:hypothetical protein